MAYSLRLIEDWLAANATAPVLRAPRVLYAVEGALLADGASEPTPAVGPGAGRARAAATPARVYRVELVRQPPPPAGGRVLLEHPIDLTGGSAWAGGSGWLLPCDRVGFDPGGVPPPHRHQGGRLRRLPQGRLHGPG